MESQGPRTIDIGQFKTPRPPTRVIVTGVLILVGLIIVMSAVFTIDPEEVGVVLRFGRYVRASDPGLNFKLPAPIERVYKVPVQRQLKEEYGFRTERAGVRTTYSPRGYDEESLMLTGDLNVAVVEWIAQYRVRDPYKFLFKVRNVRQTFRDMNESVVRAVIGDRSVDEVITIGRQQIEDEVKIRLQELCDQYDTGIVVDQIVLQDVNPPDPVKPSFNEVNQAEQERERSINDARAEYNRIIPRAHGEAEQTIAQAQGYAVNRVNSARGDVVLFDEVLAAYRRAPEVTRRRIYLETMEAVYPNVKQKVLLDSNLDGLLPLLQLQGAGGDK
jgi:membrane protease subunit HflK